MSFSNIISELYQTENLILEDDLLNATLPVENKKTLKLGYRIS